MVTTRRLERSANAEADRRQTPVEELGKGEICPSFPFCSAISRIATNGVVLLRTAESDPRTLMARSLSGCCTPRLPRNPLPESNAALTRGLPGSSEAADARVGALEAA